jgi:hypothetical protein
MIVGTCTPVAIDAGATISVIVVHGAARLVDGDLMIVHSQPIALGVGVGEEAPLEHAIG